MATASIKVNILGNAKGFTDALQKSSKGLGGFAKDLGKFGAKAALASGAVIGGAVATGVFEALGRQDITQTLANNLGLTEAQSAQAGAAAAAAYGKGFGESFEETAAIASTLAGLGVQGEEALTTFTQQATAITKTFGVDQAELLASTSALIDRGFVQTTAEAFDLLATSAEGSFIPLSEQLDLMNEYGDQINQVGLTGEEAFGLISKASSSFEADKILDSFKELAIRGQDMSDTSVAALESLGLEANEVANAFALGGTEAGLARDQIVEALGAIEDPVERNTLGVALMGTAFEDLGQDPLSKLRSVGAELEVSANSAELLAEKSLTTQDRLAALGRQGQNALAQVGEALLPVIEDLMPSLVAGTEQASQFMADNLPKAIEFAKQAFEELRPVIDTIIDGFANIVGWIQDNWPAIQDVVLSVVQAIADWIQANVPPIQDAVLTVFGAIVDWVSDNWPEIQAVITEVMETIGAIIVEVVELVSAVWARWGDEILLVVETIFKAIVPIIRAAMDLILGIIRTITALIKGDWDGVWEGIKEITQAAIDLVVGWIEGGLLLWQTYTDLAVKAVNQLWRGGWEKIKKVLSDAWDSIKRLVSGALLALKTNIDTWMSRIRTGISNVWTQVITQIRGLKGRVTSAARGIWDGIVNAFKSAVNAIIRGWNRISFRIPGFKIGPISYGGFSIGTPNIPLLASGGVLTRPTLFVGGEYGGARNNPEIVAPQRLLDERLALALEPLMKAGARPTINIENVTVLDGRDFFDELDRQTRLAS